MKMNKIYSFIIAVSLSAASMTVTAQEETGKKAEQEPLNRQMTLEREYDPTIMDASKISTLPKVREMNIQKRPIVYSDYAFPLSFDNELHTLPVGTYMTGINRYANKGYLHLAGGMLMNLNGDFGYHLLSTERDDLRIYLSHRSTNGNVTFLRAPFNETKAQLNDNVGGLDFKHTFDALTLSLGGNVGYSMFNYYGQPTEFFITQSPISSFAEKITSDTITNQANRIINIYAGVASNIPEKLGYHFGVDFTNFDQKYSLSKDYKGLTESAIKLDLGLNSPVNNGQSFGIDMKVNVLTYIAPELSAGIKPDSAAFDNRYEVTFNPYFKLDRDFLKLLLGINLMSVSQKETDFFVSPNIKLDVPFSTNSLFYIDLGGGIESNTINEVSHINRYITPELLPKASRSWIDGRLGVRSSIASGLWIDIFGGYKYTESDLFFTTSQFYRSLDGGFNATSMAIQPHSQRLQLGASLKYDYKSVFGFYLKGVYNHYTFKNPDDGNNIYFPDDIKPYGKPTTVINVGLHAKPMTPLTLNLDYSMLSGLYAIQVENIEMNAINDLRLRGSWQFNDTFSIYAQFNNLLFQKQEMYYGYPLQPFTAMLGLNINF